MKSSPFFVALFMFFGFSLHSQIKVVDGVRYPAGFMIETNKSKPSLAKAAYDTLRYKIFEKISADVTVNSGCGYYGADQRQINIASDTRGGFLCAWIDERTGDEQINAQLFDREGSRIGPMIHVSDRDASWNSEPHLTFNPRSNEFIVVWAGSGSDILLQRLSAAGEKIGSNKTVTEHYLTNTNNPSPAVDSSGNIIVTWTSDVTCCTSSIPYCRILDKAGTPLTPQWALGSLETSKISSQGWEDRSAADSIGRCVVVWSTFAAGKSRIVLQSVDRSGNRYTQPLVVSDPADSTDHIFPCVTSTKDGHFLILWPAGNFLCGRIFHPDSGFVTPQFAVMSASQGSFTCGASSDDLHTFFIVMTGSGTPYGRTLSTQGVFSGPPVALSFSSPITYWEHPRISKGIFDRVYLVFGGYVHSQSDVMLQAFDLSYHPVGQLQKVADDGCGAVQNDPAVKYAPSGRSLIVWEDRRNGYRDIYGQVFDETGEPFPPNVQISDSAMIYNSGASIACDRDGNFLVAYAAGDYTKRTLYLQKVASSGSLAGPRVTVSDRVYYDGGLLTGTLHVKDTGEILALWTLDMYSPVYARRFTSALSAVNQPYPVFNAGGSPKKIISVSANARFHTLVMWVDYYYQTHSYGKILKAMIVDEQGKKVRDTMMVARIPDDWEADYGKCTIDDQDNLAFAWSEYALHDYDRRLTVRRVYAGDNYPQTDSFAIDIYASQIEIIRFENRKAFVAWKGYTEVHSVLFDDNYFTATPVDLQISARTDFYSIEHIFHYFHADVHGDRLLIAYTGVRDPERGYDILANVQRIDRFDFQHVEPVVENTTTVYPNPSTESAVFEYLVSQPTNVSIAVYNILGQKISEIESGMKIPGKYTVKVPTRSLAAGVYFFVYEGVTTSVKKFLIMK